MEASRYTRAECMCRYRGTLKVLHDMEQRDSHPDAHVHYKLKACCPGVMGQVEKNISGATQLETGEAAEKLHSSIG